MPNWKGSIEHGLRIHGLAQISWGTASMLQCGSQGYAFISEVDDQHVACGVCSPGDAISLVAHLRVVPPGSLQLLVNTGLEHFISPNESTVIMLVFAFLAYLSLCHRRFYAAHRDGIVVALRASAVFWPTLVRVMQKKPADAVAKNPFYAMLGGSFVTGNLMHSLGLPLTLPMNLLVTVVLSLKQTWPHCVMCDLPYLKNSKPEALFDAVRCFAMGRPQGTEKCRTTVLPVGQQCRC